MIGKKVANPRSGGSKSGRIGGLCEYIEKADHEHGERCSQYGGRGFISETPAGHRAEMLALATEAVRSNDPINHYVLSWQEGEVPTEKQVVEAVDTLQDEMGLKGHQAVYGLHVDTDNIHLHIAVNRVHPVTEKPVRINGGFDKEALHRAIARIEHEQGWSRESRGRYEVDEAGEVQRVDRKKDVGVEIKQPGQAQRDIENRTGEQSAERQAITEAAPVIEAAKSWGELHESMARIGMRYAREGSGAIVWVGDVAVKASSVARKASLGKLQKRLGPYAPAAGQAVVKVRQKVVPLRSNTPEWGAYSAEKQAREAAKGEATKTMREQIRSDREAMRGQHKKQREDLVGRNWRGKGELLNAMRSVLAGEQAAAKAALKERHGQERVQLRERYRPMPGYERWLRERDQPELAEQWRYRASGPQVIKGPEHVPAVPQDIRAFEAQVEGKTVEYRRRGDDTPEAAFVDSGQRIDVRVPGEAAVLAALQLGTQKWEAFAVKGNGPYLQLCVRLAAEHGFKITNPELQERIQETQWTGEEERNVGRMLARDAVRKAQRGQAQEGIKKAQGRTSKGPTSKGRQGLGAAVERAVRGRGGFGR